MLDDIRSAVVDGNTLYYLHLTGDSHYYVISAADQPEVVIYNTGDYVTIRFADGEGTILTADSAGRTAAPVQPAAAAGACGAGRRRVTSTGTASPTSRCRADDRSPKQQRLRPLA